ncbi:MAG: hypothetical protein ACR2QW_08870 [bacterium]
MKIIVRISPPRSASRIVRKHFGDLVTNELMQIFDLDASSEQFSQYLELTRKHKEGTWFNPWMEFTEEELDQCDFLQPVCRGPVFAETDADYNQTRKWLDADSKIESIHDFKVNLLKRVCVKQRKLRPNVIAGVLQWTPDFILPTEIVKIFKRSQLRGFSVREVFNRKAQLPFQDYHLLYSDHFMPAATRVVFPPQSIPLEERFKDEFKKAGISPTRARELDQQDEEELALYGCLCYETLISKNLKDFNRTAEPWASNNFPLWVVSQRVRDVFREHNLKGWIFEPVLVKGSELCAEHKLLWKSFVGAIQVNRANHM